MSCLAFAVLPILAAAPFATVEGRLVIDGSAVDDVLDVTLVLKDGADVPLVEHVSTGVQFIGGHFVVTDLDLGAITEQQWAAPIYLTVSAGGLTAPGVPFLRAPEALTGHATGEALRAPNAAALGGQAASAFATRAALASSSGLGIVAGNLGGVPAGIADGVDDGPLTSNLGSIRVDGGGVLRIQGSAVTATAIAAGAVTSSSLASGAVTSTKLQSDAVAHAKLATGTLADADFAADSLTPLALSGTERSLYEVTAVGCLLPVGALSSSTTCERDSSGCASGYAHGCSTDTCSTIEGTGTTCANSYAGLILFGP